CRPCRPGCATCEDDTPCLVQQDQVLRAAVLACQACCMLAIFLSMLVSYHFRRSKARIRTSGIILLETILFGSLLLYFPVFILYFKPSIFRCIVLRWVRMLGFAIVYGTITLKLYRYPGRGAGTPMAGRLWVSGPPWWGGLGEGWGFRTPALGWAGSHWDGQGLTGMDWALTGTGRVPLGWDGLSLGWAGSHWDGLGSHWDGLGSHWDGQGLTGMDWALTGMGRACPAVPTAEMLFLLWGSFLCYATRAVPSAFHEPRYMGIALHNELMVSAAFHVLQERLRERGGSAGRRGSSGELGREPRVTAPSLSLQFLHTGSPLREEITAEVYEDELDMRRSGSCMNSSIASAWSEHSLDPDDIR
ncbi:GP158 protein, partial [Chloropsis cyanopogon]|nr:GP158 protein [Chloropsis cyanopogon]